MYRFALEDIKQWYSGHRRKPLVLRGARQVGKSTLVRMAAESMNLKLIEINLERYVYLDEVFKTLDISTIIDEIEGIKGSIGERSQALLFLDEIQATPHAIQALRYFYEDLSDLAVIAAGSLLEFTLANHSFSMPVGRITYYHLGPMSFEEFLMARDHELFDWYRKTDFTDSFPDSRHNKLLAMQREFLFTGGMPESVLAWIRTSSPQKVQDAQRDILNTYTDDFAKYANRADLARLQKVFRRIPQLAGKKIKYSHISPEDKAAKVKDVIDLLSKARICSKVHHSDCSGLPLAAGVNDKVFKLLFIDVGLMNCLLGLSWIDVKNMDERNLINEGSLAEQFIGQELLYLGGGKVTPELFYWLREGKGNNAEVDYVISLKGKILPVEVKSGASGSMKSLHQFTLLKNNKRAIRFDLNKPSNQKVQAKTAQKSNIVPVEFDLTSLPLYGVGKLLNKRI
ncbi:MAG: AAA family ATPase [Spirochaetales bacterium]|nr:AAA family ATPase [Spirochaetales bacterium]